MKWLEWKLHGRTRFFLRRVDEARRIVEKALKEGRFSISWSTGKDSTALAHLVRRIDPSVPIVIQYDDCDWPAKRPYAERVQAAQGWTVHEVSPDFSVWEMAGKFNFRQDEICAQDHSLTRLAFLQPLEKKQKELGCDGVFLGLRMEESLARKKNLALRGPLYRLKSGIWHCCPLWKWEVIDVFAYLVSYGIEINPCYFYNRFFKPEQIRVSWALPTPMGCTSGAMEHMRFYYPEQYGRLRDKGIT